MVGHGQLRVGIDSPGGRTRPSDAQAASHIPQAAWARQRAARIGNRTKTNIRNGAKLGGRGERDLMTGDQWRQELGRYYLRSSPGGEEIASKAIFPGRCGRSSKSPAAVRVLPRGAANPAAGRSGNAVAAPPSTPCAHTGSEPSPAKAGANRRAAAPASRNPRAEPPRVPAAHSPVYPLRSAVPPPVTGSAPAAGDAPA